MTNSKQDMNRGFIPYLIVTAILCGALVMVIEVLGSRVIGPFFGVSLFVWTSLITVTLIALALGYAVGGILADRWQSPDMLYLIIGLSGFFVLTIPWISDVSLQLMLPLGLRMGAFFSAAILFGPALFLLGCVSPYLVKISAQQMHNIGRTVGGFYALSTLGSVAGTVLTGFVLITYMGVDRIFTMVGSLLVLVTIGYFVLFRKKWLAISALLLPWIMNPAPATAQFSKLMDNGTRVTLINQQDSFYGNLKVVDYSYEQKHTRELIIDGLVQGGIDMTNNLSVYGYPYYLQFIPYALNPQGKRCLVIGLGAGIVPTWYEQQGIVTDTVDIDPAVEQLARKYFNYTGKNPVQIEDARYALNKNQQPYDYLILDVFNGDTTPGYLLSKEAIDLFAGNITANGVLGINLAGRLYEHTLMTASVVKTLATRFDQVEIYPTFNLQSTNGIGNLTVVAYMGPARTVDWQALRQYPVSPFASRTVWDNIGKQFHFPDDTPALVLTDDYNPIDFYDASLREKVRKDIIDTTDRDILL